jgi:single-strand DNA-binding protein
MNKVSLVGRLTKDPVTKEIVSVGKAVTTFYLAVNRGFSTSKEDKKADFIPVVTWGKQAEAIGKYMKKGRLVSVSGRIQVSTYRTEDNITKYITEVVADEVHFLDSKKVDSEAV